MGLKFFEITQNNSGGSFIVDDKVCHRLIIEAETEDLALTKAEELGAYWNGCDDGTDCPCCGDRWSRYTNEIDLNEWKERGYPVGIWDHYPNPEKEWQELYGSLPLNESPKWKVHSVGSQFEGKVYFDTIEQYAQFMANSYGWTTPDIRIFFANGEVKEIFKPT